MWQYRGQQRPPFAQAPQPGQESVWDYPRPPALVDDSRLVTVHWLGEQIAASRKTCRVLETASPPTFYFPPEDINSALLEPDDGSSYCEWKGAAQYFQIVVGEHRLRNVAWCYPDPTPGFQAIAGWLAFYPQELDCQVDGETVRAQAGSFYAGWITDDIVGPFKGDPGTGGW